MSSSADVRQILKFIGREFDLLKTTFNHIREDIVDSEQCVGHLQYRHHGMDQTLKQITSDLGFFGTYWAELD